PELGLLTLAALPRLPGLVVALAAQQRAAQPLVHAHHGHAEVAAAALGVAGLGDLEATREADQRLLGRPPPGLRQRAEAAHVRPRARDVEHGRHAAGERVAQLLVLPRDEIDRA